MKNVFSLILTKCKRAWAMKFRDLSTDREREKLAQWNNKNIEPLVMFSAWNMNEWRGMKMVWSSLSARSFNDFMPTIWWFKSFFILAQKTCDNVAALFANTSPDYRTRLGQQRTNHRVQAIRMFDLSRRPRDSWRVKWVISFANET